MKKFLSSKTFVTIITSIICITGTAYATSQILASDISYTPTWENSNGKDIETVEDAIDELYTKASKYDKLTLKIATTNFSSSSKDQVELRTDTLSEKYKFFKITNISNSGGVTACRADSWTVNSNGETLESNVQYNTENYLFIEPFIQTTSANTRANCSVIIEFYN